VNGKNIFHLLTELWGDEGAILAQQQRGMAALVKVKTEAAEKEWAKLLELQRKGTFQFFSKTSNSIPSESFRGSVAEKCCPYVFHARPLAGLATSLQ
jgi:hypothetical protein